MRLTPYAWSKLLFLRDAGPTEIGGFGISSACDLLLIGDVRLISQVSSVASVKFDDAAVADHFDREVDAGRNPQEFARIWIHTHPGHSPAPSLTDEETFDRCFASADWALMFILARGGRTYARLRFRAGPGGQLLLPVEVDFSPPFAAAIPEQWQREYAECVKSEERFSLPDRQTLNCPLISPRIDEQPSGVNLGKSEHLDASPPGSPFWPRETAHERFDQFLY